MAEWWALGRWCGATHGRCGAGSYKSVVVRLSTFDTKNWRSLLQFRERLLQRGWPRLGSEEWDLEATAAMQEAGTGNSDTTPPPEQSTVVRRIIHIENRPISREKRATIRREANGTLGVRAVAKRHGVHESTVRAIWRQRPRPARRGPHRFTQEHRQRAEVLVARASPSSTSAWSSGSTGGRCGST